MKVEREAYLRATAEGRRKRGCLGGFLRRSSCV